MHFILMADIMGSGKAESSALIHDFKSAVKQTNHTMQKGILSPLTITLGDEFQGVIKDLAQALQVILTLEEHLIHASFQFRLRYVLHQGPIETPLNTDTAHGMLGPGLTKARHLLNQLKKQPRGKRFHISLQDTVQAQALNEAFILLQYFLDRWNPARDYELVAAFLKNPDYKAVAASKGKTRSQIYKRHKTLAIMEYNALKTLLTHLASHGV